MRTSHRLTLPVLSLLALAIPALGHAAVERNTTLQAVTAVAQLPLRFESLDRGLLARGSGYAMMLNTGSAEVSVSGSATMLRMTWPGADLRVKPAGEERAAGATNYLIGNDPSLWRRNVPSFGKVRYRNLYPAIDLVFYGNQEQLEYDFVVHPGGDPRDIRLRFRGEDAVRIDAQGNLVVRMGATDLIQRAPLIYQEQDGARRQVAGQYVKVSRHEYGFDVAEYDRSSTLYIDPVLSFSSFAGGNANTYAKGVAVDSAGNAYVTGYTAATNFPTTPGVYGASCVTCTSTFGDVFVTKISATGVHVYSTYVGSAGNTDDRGHGIAVDSAGNAYVTGETSYSGTGPAFPVVNGFTIDVGAGAFLFKLNSTGSSLLYSTLIRSGSGAAGYGVAVEGTNAYVAGMTVPNDSFPLSPTSGTFSGFLGVGGGLYQAFIMKINTSAAGLASLTWATRFGGSDRNYAYAVAVNTAGEAYVTGDTSSSNFPVVNAAQASFGGSTDAFVSKFNAAGSALLYSTFAGETAADSGYGIAIDASGNAFVAGDLGNDAFILKLSPNGSAFDYFALLGGGSIDSARAVAVDSGGYAHVAGFTTSADFPVTAGAIQPAQAGSTTDAFVSVIDPTGTTLAYSSYLGGTATVSGGDRAFGIALDAAADVWMVGQTDSADFPVKPGAIQTTHGSGLFDAFIVKIGEALSLTAVIPASGGTSGGPVRLTGTGFMAGASATFGGVAATSVSVVSTTTITAVRPPHAAGAVNVVVTNLDGQVATLAGGFTYVTIPPLTFTDNPLQAQITPIRAIHITELRAAINTIRARYALSAATWPSGDITSGTVVQAAHLTELRSALADVYTAAALATPAWSPATVVGGTTVITAAQITQVRSATLAMW